ncbi:MAG: T9SS type A sorting domain-containing protein [Candidatus Fermentibacteraceae bacterium]|nr:T9SS type A sorting domain-containing protein [Candidatus Fermentibacteraceae bacterium]
MYYLLAGLLLTGLLFGTVYEGTTENLGIDIPQGPFPGGDPMLDLPEGVNTVPDFGILDESLLSDPNDPTSTFEYQSPVDRALRCVEEGPVWPGYDWANDVVVWPGAVGTGQDFDYDVDNGDIYACFDTDHTTLDSLVVYRSQDGGQTWSFFGVATNTDGEISNPKICVLKDSGGTSWVVAMGIWIESGDDLIWTRRWTTSGGSPTFEQAGTAVAWADMDSEVGTGAWAFITYVPTGTHDVYATRNAINGSGWVNNQSLFGDTYVTSYPAVGAGAGGRVSVAFIDDRLSATPQVRIKRSLDHGSTWQGSEQVSNTAAENLENCDVAFSHGTTQTGWIITTFAFSSGDNIGFYYSQDSGVTWTYGYVFSPSGGDENLGSIGTRKVNGDVTLAFNADPGDSIMFAWTDPGDPTGFDTPVRVNDFAATGFWPPAAGWASNWSAVLYTNWNTNYRLMWDWYGNTQGIEGTTAGPQTVRNAPNPFSSVTNISFELAQSSPVTISIYNLAGQLVNRIADGQSFGEGSNSVQWDGRNFSGELASPGVYFCRLDANGLSQTHRMMMVR